MKRYQVFTQKEYDVLEFLTLNKEELLKDIKPEVAKFLERQHLFKGVFKVAYDRAYVEFVLSSIKQLLMSIFNLTYEEIECIVDFNVVSLLTDNLFFDRSNYV